MTKAKGKKNEPRTWDAPQSGLAGLEELKVRFDAAIRQRVAMMRQDAGVPDDTKVLFDGRTFTEVLEEN